MLSNKGGTAGAVVKGLLPDRARRVLAVGDYVVKNNLDRLADPAEGGAEPIVLGIELARVLGVKADNLISLISPLHTLNPKQ